MANSETLYRGPYEFRIRRVKPKNIDASWGKPLSDPLSAARVAYNLSKEEDQEVMSVIGLDGADRVMFIHEIYRGTNASIVARPAELFRAAVIENASKVLIYHNHTQGDPTPSAEDISTLTRVVESGKILGIGIHDYQVVCDDPNLFWSAQIAVGGNLMQGDLSNIDPNLVIDIKRLKEFQDAKNNL